MAVKSSGTINMSEIANEFGGDTPYSLSEYYRGTGVPDVAVNDSVPTSGAISMGNFYGATNVVTVQYDIIGAGGGGGGGRNSNQDAGIGLFILPGGNSVIRLGALINLVNAAGGSGGRSYALRYDAPGGAGQGSDYGPGGTPGSNDQPKNGGAAPATSYGAGGGGGGGDQPSALASSGNRGEGGFAGTRLIGSFTIVPGTTLSVIVGAGGLGHTNINPGGNGAGGFARLTFGGQEFDYTVPGTYSITVT